MSTNPPSARRDPAMIAPVASRTSPKALTTASAATDTRSAPSPAAATAQPTPPFIAHAGPAPFPTVAPVPAPMLPSAISSDRASSHAAYAIAGVGRASKRPSGARSKMTAAGTIGTTPGPTAKPRPRSSIQRITPAAASSP